MVDTPWQEHAVVTRQDSDGLRSIVMEGTLRQVVEQIADSSVTYGDLRISLPERRQAPTSWVAEQVVPLVRTYRLSQPDPKGSAQR